MEIPFDVSIWGKLKPTATNTNRSAILTAINEEHTMSNDDQAPARYHFSSAVGILAGFERLGIEHLEVSNKRTIVIYQRTIFGLDVLSGHLDTAQTVKVEVFDISPDIDADTDPMSLVERLIDTLATSANVNWDRQG